MNQSAYIPRFIQDRIEEALTDTPVVLIHGPRQSGKTTLARHVGQEKGFAYYSFDDVGVRSAAQDDPAGFVAGLLASIWTGNWAIGAVVTIAMTLNLLMAGFVGVSVPLTMRALKVDPALASTVFVTATTDVFGFFVFLGLATLLLV